MSQPATWTETASATGGATVTASHAAEAGKTHYLCGLIVSCDMGQAQPPETVEVQVRDGPVFGGIFADKVCLQDLSAFWPGFGGFSADKVCLQSLSVRTSCADKVCLQNRCRQSLSACPRVRLQHPPDDKLCLQ